MLFLVIYIMNHRCEMLLCEAYDSIASLPLKGSSTKLLGHFMRTASLYFSDEIAQMNKGFHLKYQMNMRFGASNLSKMNAFNLAAISLKEFIKKGFN